VGIGDPDGHDYRIIVRGGGVRQGLNFLTVDGTDAADRFLFRPVAAIAEQPDAVRPAFVAVLGENDAVERITYDAGINARLTVNGYDGDDEFVFDGTTVLTTVYGGDGADTFTVGQFFGAAHRTERRTRRRLRDGADGTRLGVARHPLPDDPVRRRSGPLHRQRQRC
jgi:hypothetical protein